MVSLASLTGTVASFDEARGLGFIADSAGLSRRFHCVSIADGSRSIAPGTAVRFTVIAAADGTWEAGAIEPA